MQRRTLIGLMLGGLAVAGAGCSGVSGTRSDNTVVAGMSARAARELARVNDRLNQRPLTPAARLSLQKGEVVPQNIPLLTLPERMLQGLPEVDGHEWYAAGIDLLLIETDTQILAEILRGPLR